MMNLRDDKINSISNRGTTRIAAIGSHSTTLQQVPGQGNGANRTSLHHSSIHTVLFSGNLLRQETAYLHTHRLTPAAGSLKRLTVHIVPSSHFHYNCRHLACCFAIINDVSFFVNFFFQGAELL